LDDARVKFKDPLEARRAGVATIHQELSLVGPMSIADNLALSGAGPLVRPRKEIEAARDAIASVGLLVDPNTRVADLPVFSQQLVEIAKALRDDARVLVLDEPTSALSEIEARRLFARIEELKAQDKAILFVSHRIDEVLKIADRVTVLRDGKAVLSKPT